MVGDIIVLDSSAGKKYVKQEAQVVKVSAKMVVVNFLSLKEKQRSFPKAACKVLQPSTMRMLSSRTGPKATTGASAAAALAATATGTTAPMPEEDVNEEEYAEQLFGKPEDES